MASIGIDHIAIPTADAERLILFYKKLGFTINDEKEWREGKVNIFNIQVGDSKITLLGNTAKTGARPIQKVKLFTSDGSTSFTDTQLLASTPAKVLEFKSPNDISPASITIFRSLSLRLIIVPMVRRE